MMKNGDNTSYIKEFVNYAKGLLSGQADNKQKDMLEQCSTKIASIVSKNLSTIKVGALLFGALVLSRLLPLPANSEPLLGLAVLTPYLSKNNLAFIFPLAVMFVSDMFIGFHNSMLMTYSALGLAPFISKLINSKYMALGSSWLVWHLMANTGQYYPPFSIEALIFDIRFLASGLSVVVLYDVVQKILANSFQYNK
jgi:hypothetical protein|tara:strand:+ start:2513 stop:3100 length:588 start_codon:yes stop_codon:yes gene_type:complete